MKWMPFLLIAVIGMIVSLLPINRVAAATGAVIESISHTVISATDERLTFKLSGPVEPKIFTIKGDNPRLVLDFPNTSYAGKGVTPLADGKLATNLRAALHQTPEQKTRVVVDLVKDMQIRHTSDYSATDNILSVILATDAVPQPSTEALAPPVVVKQDAETVPEKAPESAAAKPVEKLPASSVVPPQAEKPSNVPETPAVTTPAATATVPAKVEKPQILDISFDDSSKKGEMVLFHLTAFHPPTVSAVEKDNPRVFCDFTGMDLGKGVEENIVAKGKYVERITTVKQGKSEKIRVTLNLTPKRDYDLQQVFFKNDNLFVLIVNELPKEKVGKNP
jgi:hypothetical protein